MTYTKDDLRSALATGPAGPRPSSDGVPAPEFFDFSLMAPTELMEAGSEQWIVRGQNFVLVYSQPISGEVLWEGETEFEHLLLVVKPDSAVRVVAGTEERSVDGDALVVMPPGRGRVQAQGSGPVVHLFQSDEPGWAERAANAASYARPHPGVAALDPWPEPVDGYRLRVYPMAEVPDDAQRFGRLFRTRAFMVNFFKAGTGPRDPKKMSPHFHDDFEQCSLTVEGTYVHHIQTPWGPDVTAWRPEDHVRVASPSVTIIPPPTIHTSQALGRAGNHLIDIFSGPRDDFSAQPGWVLNADEYPAPSS